MSRGRDPDDARDDALAVADTGDACPRCLTFGLVMKQVRGRFPFACMACGHQWCAGNHFPVKVAA